VICISNKADALAVSAPESKIFVWKPRKVNDREALAGGGLCARLNPVKNTSVQPAKGNLRYIDGLLLRDHMITIM